MKTSFLRTLTITGALILFLNHFSAAQSFDNIANAIRSGNASAIASSFQANVEITIKDSGNSYSKSQAEMVLKDFFSKNQPKGFTIAHQGTSPEGSKYFIGNLATGNGNYRMYVYAKANGTAFTIQEIRFEEQ
ncbi:MAG: DUF4783 domain-containing protein [Chitinophagales bacterium]|jgi:hypothetical protein|nr:DUF4783 domain-containing protein [Chitinophagales bacterium]